MFIKTIGTDNYINLLQQLIAIPSFSKEETVTADLLQHYFNQKNIDHRREGNNIWAFSKYHDDTKPTILLNSHHDTVKPVAGWTRDPFQAALENGKLYGLGSNDAGASLVALLAVFEYFYHKENLPFNLLYAATAEEEISGKNGISSVKKYWENIAFGIIGEPTKMQMATAEKGLMVVDATAHGKAGHAAREEGDNAIYKALKDIEKIQQFKFPQVSELLGRVKLSVTQINAGTQHNVVPDRCTFVMDVRSNEFYSNEQIFAILDEELFAELSARSFRLNSSGIELTHPIVQSGMALGLEYFGSPTLSDQALLDFPTLKIGPGDSARSHTADEYIQIEEIEDGIKTYIDLLQNLKL